MSSLIVLTTALAASSGILYGFNLGIIAGAILGIERDFALSEALKEATISAALLGAMIGALAGGLLADRFGRKSVIVGAAVLAGAAALLGASAQSAWTIIGSRAVTGVSFGLLACVTPILIAEISPTAQRGRLLATFSVALMVGLLIAYAVDLAFDRLENGWRWMIGAGIVPALPLVLLAARIPESPSWLSIRGDREAALRSLSRLGSPDGELAAQTSGQARSGDGGLFMVLAPAFRRGLIAALGLAFIRQGTGVAISTFYAPEILELAGIGSRVVELAGTVGVGILYVAMTLVALSVVDRYGRRPLMLAGLIGMCAGLIALGLAVQAPHATPMVAAAGITGLFLFAAAFAIGPGAVVFVLMSEVLPQKVRAMGMGLASFVLWLTAFLSALTFPFLEHQIGNANVFFLYAGLCALSLLFVHLVVPETKGRALEEIGSK